MKMYFNGCSFTYGDELVEPRETAWPVLVARHYGDEFYNDAVSGGTNQRSVYKTILNINQFDYFVICWTSYARFTLYNPVDNFEINFHPRLALDSNLHYSNDLINNYAKYKDYGTLYYKHWFNEFYEFKKWLQQIALMQSFFKDRSVKYAMLNAFSNQLSTWLQPAESFVESIRPLCSFFDYSNDDQLLNEHRQIQDLMRMIDTEKFIGFNSWCINDLSATCPVGVNGHILEDGHRQVADIVIKHIDSEL